MTQHADECRRNVSVLRHPGRTGARPSLPAAVPHRQKRGLRRGLPIAMLAGMLTLAGCGMPTLLDPGQLPDGEYTSGSSEEAQAGAVGWLACSEVGSALQGMPGTEVGTQGFLGGRTYVGASLFTAPPGQSTALNMAESDLNEAVETCRRAHEENPHSIHVTPLRVTPRGTYGWEFSGDEVGQLVVDRLNDGQLLVVGLAHSVTDGLPIDLDKLVDVARQGADEFPPSEER